MGYRLIHVTPTGEGYALLGAGGIVRGSHRSFEEAKYQTFSDTFATHRQSCASQVPTRSVVAAAVRVGKESIMDDFTKSIAALIGSPSFRAEMARKGRMSRDVEAVPVRLVSHPNSVLVGLEQYALGQSAWPVATENETKSQGGE